MLDLKAELYPVVVTAVSSLSLYAVLKYLSYSKKKNGKKPKPFPPSPPGDHWLWGHAIEIHKYISRNLHPDLLFLKLSKEYGTVFSVRLPFLPDMIIVADPDMAKHIVSTKNYPKSPTYTHSIGLLMGKRNMVMLEGDAWSSKRRLYNPCFSPNFLRDVVSVIDRKCGRLVARCDVAARRNDEVNLHCCSTELTADVIAQVVFGEDWGGLEEGEIHPTLQIMKELVEECEKNSSNPLFSMLNIRARRKLKKIQSDLDEQMLAVVNRRISDIRSRDWKSGVTDPSAGGGAVHEDILSVTLRALETEEGTLTKDDLDDVVSQLKTFYFAGYDTTGTLIAWTVWTLALHPTECDRVREEALSELGEWARSARLRHHPGSDDAMLAAYPTYEEIQRCSYLDCVVKEVLRLHPPASSARYCSERHANFGGYRIDQHILYVNAYVMHRHPDLWDNPDVFRPARFLEAENRRKLDSSFIPFSKGKRDCIGRHLATLEAKVAVLSLVLNFDFVALDQNETIGRCLTARPLNGCMVSVSRR